MDGVREASAHTIVFQARAGTPELNCCSVNGPRVLGMLSDWAVMSASNGLVVNWLGAGRFTGQVADGVPVTIASGGEAWRDGHTDLRVVTAATQAFTLRVRIPAWARSPVVTVNDTAVPDVTPGNYMAWRRTWTGTNRLELKFKLPVRFVAGANEAAGKVSLYRGPLLLAFDQAQNACDEAAVPAINLARLGDARIVAPPGPESTLAAACRPWLLVDVPTVEGRGLRLVDFASAGAPGTRYRSWLSATNTPPPPAFTQIPSDAARVPLGPVLFQWRGSHTRETSYRVEVSSDPTFTAGPDWSTNVTATRVVLDSKDLSAVAEKAGASLYWRAVSRDLHGETVPDVPPAWFRLDPSAPPQTLAPGPKPGPNGELIVHGLRGDAPPEFGQLKTARFSARDADGTEVNGRDQMLVYAVSPWPEEEFTVSLRVLIKEFPPNRLGQVFSAWAAGMDDPLRLVVDGKKLWARIEAGGGFSTPGAPVETGRWYSVSAVKRGGTLTLYLDGQVAGACAAPEFGSTRAEDCALGGNPHFSGSEFLAARFADFRFYARALSLQEIQALTARR
jgi:hypothetical protein